MTKSVLITGAATRIGRTLAEGLADDGWNIIVHYNTSHSEAEDLLQALRAKGGMAMPLKADLAEPKQRSALIETAVNTLGHPLDALINNASVYIEDTARDFTEKTASRHFEVNLKAPIILSRYFANALPENRKGTILNIIDQRVLHPAPHFFTYTLSKSALYAATKTMAQAFAPQIRVNAIGPGPTLKSIHQTQEEFETEAASTLLGYGSRPETLLEAARYLLKAEAVTGHMIAVDGGQHLGYEKK